MHQELDSISILLIFLMVAIMSIFCISLLVVMIRKSVDIKRLRRFGFIGIIIGYILSKGIICGWLLIRIIIGIPNQWEDLTADQIQILFKNSLITAEIFLVLLFLTAFQFYITRYISIIPRLNSISSKLQKIFYTIQATYLLTSSILLILFNTHIISYQAINLYQLIMNSLIIISFLIIFFYLSFLMTGIMLSDETRDNINRLFKYVLLLIFSRFTVLAFQFVVELQIKDGSFQGFITLLEKNRNQEIIQCGLFIGYLLYILLSQGLPIMYSLRRVVIKVFIVLKSSQDTLIFSQQNIRQPLNQTRRSSSQTGGILQTLYDEALQQIESIQNFTGLEALTNINSDIWKYYRGQYKSKLFLIKQSKSPISNYLIEDAQKQISLINNKNIISLNEIGHFENNQIIHLYQPYRHKKLVDQALKQKSIKNRIKIAIKLAESIKQMHQNNFIHGCLSSNNIFLIISGHDNNISYRVKLSGYGLQSLKRYFALTTDYANKTIYTAPEYLLMRNSVVLKPKKEADIYSFGMILYEIMTQNLTYRNLTLQDLQKQMGQADFRPKIPDNINPTIKNIIRQCWHKNIIQRPHIDQIIKNLQTMEHTIENY